MCQSKVTASHCAMHERNVLHFLISQQIWPKQDRAGNMPTIGLLQKNDIYTKKMIDQNLYFNRCDSGLKKNAKLHDCELANSLGI